MKIILSENIAEKGLFYRLLKYFVDSHLGNYRGTSSQFGEFNTMEKESATRIISHHHLPFW